MVTKPFKARKDYVLRVYTLDDGTKWTIVDIQNKIKSKWKTKDVELSLVRARIFKHTDPEKVFAKPIVTRPRTVLTKSQKDIDREMMKLALRNI
tara:strand:- start:273 stop:554 length:282 start_codon:yes stop_codon:yes gene_type:complete